MSLSHWLLTIPEWVALLAILSALTVPSIVGFFIVHRLVPVAVRRAHNDVAGFVFAAVAVMYGVLLAFVVIIVWEQYDETRTSTLEESSAALSLHHAMEAYADTTHLPVFRAAVLAYLRGVVDQEFPAMAELSHPPATNAALEAMWERAERLSPSLPREQVLYQELIDRLNQLEGLRAQRLNEAHDQLPHAVWLAIIPGAMLTIGFVFLMGTENANAQALMVGVLAALIGVVLYVIIELDHPFSGSVRIGSDDFQQVIEMISRVDSSR